MNKLWIYLLLLLPVTLPAQRFVDITSAQKPAPPGSPTINESGSFSTFTMTVGSGPSAAQTITVSGSSLTANVGVAFTGGGASSFQVSKDGTNYASSQTLTVGSGIITGQPVTLYVRVIASAGAGTPSANLSLTSTGATTVNVAVNANITTGSVTFKAITIDHTKVPNTDQTSFPMSFDITQTYLKTVANGGGVINASGFDINFWADNSGTTALAWDMIKWDGSAGRIIGTVKIPTLSHSTNTVIYVSYGNTSVTTFQGSVAGSVWDANYLRAWHMDEVLTGTGQTITDGTTNSGNMSSVGSWVSGQSVSAKIGNGLKLLNSSSTYATFSSLGLTTTYTIEGWFNPTSATVDGSTFAFTGTSSNDELAWGDPAGYVGLFGNNGSNKIQSSGFSGAPWTSNSFHHLVITRNGTAWTMYLDGASNATSSQGVNVTLNALGFSFSTPTNDLICDELRISSVVRSADWITTEYNNQNSPNTFYSVAP